MIRPQNPGINSKIPFQGTRRINERWRNGGPESTGEMMSPQNRSRLFEVEAHEAEEISVVFKMRPKEKQRTSKPAGENLGKRLCVSSYACVTLSRHVCNICVYICPCVKALLCAGMCVC